jgi:hypothetical protein
MDALKNSLNKFFILSFFDNLIAKFHKKPIFVKKKFTVNLLTKISSFAFLIGIQFGIAQNNSCLPTESFTQKEGVSISKIRIEYDKFDNIISREVIQYFGNSSTSSKLVNEYKNASILIKSQYFVNNVLTKSIDKQYNNLGILIAESEFNGLIQNNSGTLINNKFEQVYFNEDGSVAAKTISEKSNLEEKISKYNANNVLISSQRKLVNASGKILENENNDFLGKIKILEKNLYNNSNDILKSEEYVNDVLKSYKTYQYENNLLRKLTAFDITNTEDYRIEYNYENGKVIEEIAFYKKELSGKKVKSYDQKNNCIKETNYNKNGLTINETTFKYTCK